MSLSNPEWPQDDFRDCHRCKVTPTGFTFTARITKVCPDSSDIKGIGVATATSIISKEDAVEKATILATERAEQALVGKCPDFVPDTFELPEEEGVPCHCDETNFYVPPVESILPGGDLL